MERWKAVPGLEGRYEVSDQGKVRSLLEYRQPAGQILRTWRQVRGYHYVSLRNGDGSRRTYAVHRLVLEAFIGPCPIGCQAAHGNGDPDDNRLDNLRWSSAKENIADRTRHGRTVRGEAQKSAKLDRYVVKTIKKMRGAGFSSYETARLACVSPSTVQRIWDGELWSHV